MHPSEADGLEFDEENEGHLARHHVTPLEVFQVLRNTPKFVPNKRGHEARWLMLGDTDGARPLCRSSSRRTRGSYDLSWVARVSQKN